MNCLEFRRFYTATPLTKSNEIKKHLQSCPACHAFALLADEFEANLVNTINIDAPQGMEERIISAKKITDKKE